MVALTNIQTDYYQSADSRSATVTKLEDELKDLRSRGGVSVDGVPPQARDKPSVTGMKRVRKAEGLYRGSVPMEGLALQGDHVADPVKPVL